METIIRAGNNSAVIESKGAELKSLVLNGRELMWEGNPAIWGKTSPVLFPSIGGLKDGKAFIDGVEYSMTKHGFARDYEFEAVSRPAEARNTVGFVLHENPETLKMFPFKFSFTMRYHLTESKLEILYEVANNSDLPMPYCIGAHPAFACPVSNNGEGKRFENYRLVFQEKETVCCPVLDPKTRLFKSKGGVWRLKNSNEFPLAHSLFDNDVLYFRSILSKNVSLLDNENKGIRVSWDGFNSLGVWSPAGMKAGFVCIEPWCGCDDFDDCSGDFRDKPEIQTCLPGGSKYYVLTVETVL